MSNQTINNAIIKSYKGVINNSFFKDLYTILNNTKNTNPFYFIPDEEALTIFHKPFLLSPYLLSKAFQIEDDTLIPKTVEALYEKKGKQIKSDFTILSVTSIGSVLYEHEEESVIFNQELDGFMIGASFISNSDAEDYQFTYHGLLDAYVIEYKLGDKTGYAIYNSSKLINNETEISDTLYSSSQFLQAWNYVMKEESYSKTVLLLKPGLYRAFLDDRGNLQLVSKTLQEQSKVIHPNRNSLFKDASYFFQVLLPAGLTKKGSRKVLLTGEPGTGKTSMINNLVHEYYENCLIAYVSDFNTLANLWKNSTKSEVPLIIVYEDVETELSNGGSSALLNILDGANEPISDKGTYIIFTSNNPEMIEDRIKKRKGRMDERINIGKISGKYMNECFNHYLSNMFKVNESSFGVDVSDKIKDICGAEILNVVSSLHKYLCVKDIAVSDENANEHLTTENIMTAYNTVQEEYSMLNKVSSEYKSHSQGLSFNRKDVDTFDYNSDEDY